jgi:hypothetical protein
MSGWIKLHRSLKDHFLFDFNEPDKALAWIDLLLSASFEDSKIKIKGRVVDVKRGQFCASQVTLQQRWGMSQNKVKRFLNLLKNEGMVDVQTNELTTIITICNYDSYQDNERAGERANGRAGERSTNEQTNDIIRIKEDKELNTAQFAQADALPRTDGVLPFPAKQKPESASTDFIKSQFDKFYVAYKVKKDRARAEKTFARLIM